MGEGDCLGITAQPEYAFGSKGDQALNIPPDSTVYYEIELKKFYKIEPLVKGVYKKMLSEGIAYAKPRDGAKVKIECEGRIAGQEPFYKVSPSEEIIVGEGVLPEVVDLGISFSLQGKTKNTKISEPQNLKIPRFQTIQTIRKTNFFTILFHR